MLLSISDMISIIRNSVNIYTDEDGVTDSMYLTMSDEDITLYIKLGASRAYPDVEDLSDLPDGSEYAVVTLAKIELYLALATRRADKVDLGADNNNYIKLDQRFKHYMDLANALKDEYEQYLNNEGDGLGTINSFDVLLNSRHYTLRNYEKQRVPKVSLKIDSFSDTDVEFHWTLKNYSYFGRYKVYINENSPVVDKFLNGARYIDKIAEGAKLIINTTNIRNVSHRLSGLKADTLYYIAVFEVERNQVFGYSEVSFTTLSAFEDEDEVNTTDISGG